MASILDLLKTETGQQLIKGASNETGVTKEKASSVLSMALPAILSAMKGKSQSDEGAKQLNSTLESSEHDGSILNNLGNMLGGDNSKLLSSGASMLGNVLGGKESALTQNISKMTGVDASSVDKIIKMAMPVIMGFIGKQKREAGVGSNGLQSLLGTAMGASEKHDESMLTTLLDADGDGSMLDDVAGKFLGGDKKKGDGGMLGGLFGK